MVATRGGAGRGWTAFCLGVGTHRNDRDPEGGDLRRAEIPFPSEDVGGGLQCGGEDEGGQGEDGSGGDRFQEGVTDSEMHQNRAEH